MTLLNDSSIEISCPHCGKKTKKRIGGVKNKMTLTCTACGTTSSFDARGLKKGQASAEANLAAFKRSISKFGK